MIGLTMEKGRMMKFTEIFISVLPGLGISIHRYWWEDCIRSTVFIAFEDDFHKINKISKYNIIEGR